MEEEQEEEEEEEEAAVVPRCPRLSFSLGLRWLTSIIPAISTHNSSWFIVH